MDRHQTQEALAARAELRKTLPTINFLETRDIKLQLEDSIKTKFDEKMKVVKELYQSEIVSIKDALAKGNQEDDRMLDASEETLTIDDLRLTIAQIRQMTMSLKRI